MIVIADSGSTKTDWALLNAGEISYFSGPGLNPFYQDCAALTSSISTQLATLAVNHITKVYFYGAGCTPGMRSQLMQEALKGVAVNAEIQVSSDLIGAAHAALGQQSGFIAILGTGMNSGYFDGQTIAVQVPALGYLLGDEGSGAWLGKQVVKDYLRNQLPEPLTKLLLEELHTNQSAEVIALLKQQTYPNRWLAGIVGLFKNQVEHPYIRALVAQGFELFYREVLMHYANIDQHKINVCGSIPFLFQTEWKAMLAHHQLQAGKIIHRPIQELAQYHNSL